MKWEGRQGSDNVEDRRGMGTTGKVAMLPNVRNGSGKVIRPVILTRGILSGQISETRHRKNRGGDRVSGRRGEKTTPGLLNFSSVNCPYTKADKRSVLSFPGLMNL